MCCGSHLIIATRNGRAASLTSRGASAARSWQPRDTSGACFGKMIKTAVCSAVDRKSQGTSPRAGPPPSRPGWVGGWVGGGTSAVVPAPNVAAGCRAPRASRGGRFLLPGPPPRVTSTGCLCYFHRGRGKGRLHIFPEAVARPGRGSCPLSAAPAPTQARRGVVRRLKDVIPLSTSIYTQKYTPWAYIFEPLLNLLPRRGWQPGARGRAARPPARPHSNPLHPPNSLKQITGCATES